MPTLLLPDSSAPRRLPSLAALLAALALALAAYHYFTGEARVIPWQLVPHLATVPLRLDSVAVGPARLPLPVNGFITTFTHDVGGPYTRPEAAGWWLGILALALTGWLAVVSGLRRPAFLAGTVPVIFLLLSLNLDALGIFDSTSHQFLGLSLGLLGAAALGLQVVGEQVPLSGRVAIFGALLAILVGLICWKTALSATESVLQVAAYGIPAGAIVVGLLVLWVGVENIRALLWFNTQAERPEGRFGLLPLVLSSLLYLGALALYYWNNGDVALIGGLHLDPLVLLLPAVLTAGLGLRQRAPSYAGWVPLAAARHLYWLLVAAAAGALGYALATANIPLLTAARDFTVLALGLLGAAFLLYVLINFGSLIKQRLRVYRVAFEPRRLPFYAVYVLGLAIILLVEIRFNFPLLDQVAAGQYNQLGDLVRQQSEAQPDDLPLALLAERYYAESGDLFDRYNRPAQLGRAALYRFRDQRQNELNALHRALARQPDAKVSAHLNSLLTGPADFFEALETLRQSRRATPGSFPLTSDLAQLFTRSALTDSVAHYLDQAERLAPASYVSRTNQLGFLLSQNLYPAAQKLAADSKATPAEPALLANKELLQLLVAGPPAAIGPVADSNLDAADFAYVYQTILLGIRAKNQAAMQTLLPALAKLIARPANAAYYEQLLFLEALLCHATGQEMAARQLVSPLAVGTSATAGYYQYVLGLWQLQQQQYATAAKQLEQAAAHGAGNAYVARAWALAMAGQPDSANAAGRRLAASADPAQRIAGRQLVADLAVAKGLVAKSLVAVIGNNTLKQARVAEATSPAQAAKLYQQLVKEAPFNEAAILAAASYYSSHHDAGAAYEALRLGLLENPDSPTLLQAYALTAASAGLAELGQSGLDELRTRLSPAAYTNLLAEFAARRAAHAAAAASFSDVAAPPR